MTEAGAQKRKAEDEVKAIGNSELGETAAPAVKKVKVEGAEPSPLPATTVAAARGSGVPTTTDDCSKKSEASAPTFSAPSFPAGVKDTETASANQGSSTAAAEAASTSIKPDTEAVGAKAEPTDTNAEMTDANVDPPQTLGYKTFSNGDDAFQYFHELIHNLRQNQDLNEYEASAVLDLVKKGHPEVISKIGAGVRALQVREHADMDSVCFHIMRTDQTIDNFSTRKCVARLFPKWESSNKMKTSDRDHSGGRGGRGGRGRGGGGGGRGGGGRGRGGRRGRGRGRGRN